MNITVNSKVKISEIINGFVDYGEDGVIAYGGKLIMRPAGYREFIYTIQQQNAIIEAILNGRPLGAFYWFAKEDRMFECIDGQQRLMSICAFSKDAFPVGIENMPVTFSWLKEHKSPYYNKFMNYELLVVVCIGTEDEKRRWSLSLNESNDLLTPQEKRNIIYSGSFVESAEKYFSKSGCPAWYKTTKAYGNIFHPRLRLSRQEWLEQVILWKGIFDGINEKEPDGVINKYMAAHMNDVDAKDLIEYFEKMVLWIKRNFCYRKLMEECEWGSLYNKYNGVELKISETDSLISTLISRAKSDNITRPKGIYEYVLSGEIRFLSDRTFPVEIKLAKWDAQGHRCAVCREELSFEDGEGDHILSWSAGGTTVYDNCQILCSSCNSIKANKLSKEAKEMFEKLVLHIPEKN